MKRRVTHREPANEINRGSWVNPTTRKEMARTYCGKDVFGPDWVTRNIDEVTCRACLRTSPKNKEATTEEDSKETGLTNESDKFFRELAEDAVNWNGSPLLDGNVRTNKALRGNVTDLKKKGLITTELDEGNTWVYFTDKGRELAEDLGIDLGAWY